MASITNLLSHLDYRRSHVERSVNEEAIAELEPVSEASEQQRGNWYKRRLRRSP